LASSVAEDRVIIFFLMESILYLNTNQRLR
jgi:hypothetical protein